MFQLIREEFTSDVNSAGVKQKQIHQDAIRENILVSIRGNERDYPPLATLAQDRSIHHRHDVCVRVPNVNHDHALGSWHIFLLEESAVRDHTCGFMVAHGGQQHDDTRRERPRNT